MTRRDFFGKSMLGGVLGAARAKGSGEEGAAGRIAAPTSHHEEVVVERAHPGKLHSGKVLAAIQPHADDIPLFAGGTVAKLISEGYTGYLIRASNDEKAGSGTSGETILSNERDNNAVAKALGISKVFNLGYRNHEFDEISRQEMRARLIFLIRLLKIDAIVCYDPWGLYEENPDHSVTAQVVEAACWMAGMDKDYPEHFAAGLQPHSVQEKYYFARGLHSINRVVDISPWIDRKVEANLANTTQGPAGNHGAQLRAQLAGKRLRLPLLGDNDETANRQYIKQIVLDLDSEHLRGVASDREVGRPYGLEWAEPFHYIGLVQSELESYISQHAVPL